MEPTRAGDLPEVRGLALRYAVLLVLARSRQTLRIAEIVDELAAMGVRPGGTQPAHKVVADAMRWELRRYRVLRIKRGSYRLCRTLSESTRRRAAASLRSVVSATATTNASAEAVRSDRSGG
jgi:hypothetical protein